MANNVNVEHLESFVPTPFWKEYPSLYFTHIENQFAFCGITKDETKYHLLIANFEREILSEIRNLILNPPATDKYETLKSRLIERFTEPEHIRIKQLVHGLQLGSDRPSHLLRKMRMLSIEVPDSLLKMLWLMRLPPRVVNVLEGVTTADLDSLSKLADSVIEEVGISSTPKAKECDACVTLQKQVDNLTKEIQDLRLALRTPPRSPSRNSFFQGPSSEDSDPSRICWYHHNFGIMAHKCKPPCDY